MPKHEPMTAKAIGKKIKSKGLQKVKFFCQMCEKQCRDANGFKCHIASESHQRQILLFAENPEKYLGGYSDDFLKPFLYLLKTRFGTRRVAINTVYQEYIKDKDHVHLNSTRWVTLTGLAKWLGRKAICEVEDTDKGWYISWVDRDPDTMRRQQELQKKEKMDKDDDERMMSMLQEQIRRGKEFDDQHGDQPVEDKKDFNPTDEKITFTLKQVKPVVPIVSNPLVNKPVASKPSTSTLPSTSSLPSTSTSSKSVSTVVWIRPNLIVKLVGKKVPDRFYKKKAIITAINKDEATLKLVDSMSTVMQVKQSQLETVIPNVGKDIMIVAGADQGCKGSLHAIDTKKFQVDVQLKDSSIIRSLPYEDVCKYV